MNTYCRIWEVGGQATLTTITEGGELKAKLEIQLGSPAAPRPGALSATSGHPAAAHRSCHRGPAAKARSRARAAAYQVKKAAAANRQVIYDLATMAFIKLLLSLPLNIKTSSLSFSV